ncbi:tandem-95 repeat protein, partial [Pseudomonas sp. 1928-m]|uniref:tandem-95 repeat protein n=1 Tax=Pseudomonas sp. 1928-m TaxID=3033804 RepID=UPI0023DE979A
MLGETGQRLDPTIGFETQGLGFAGNGQDEQLGALTDAQNPTDGNALGGNTPQANRAPSAVADTFTVNEDGSVSIDVLNNDNDLDGDTLTISAVDGQAITEGGTVIVSNGSVTLTGGQLIFTPDANYNGPISFTYTITDGALSSSAVVNGSITPINDAPIAVDDSLSASEDTPITYTANDLLGNDSDVDGDTLTIASVTSGNGGTAVLNPDGTVTFTPNANFNGVADFTYTVTDGALTSNTATVTVNVAPVNDAPVAVNDSLVASEDTPITYTANDLLGNDSDVDGDTLTIASVTSGNGGTAVLNPDGTVTFTPNANFNGVADFTYTVTDGALTSNTATVTVNVAPVNDAPVAVDDSLVASEDTPITYTANDLLSNDSDVDGDTLTIASVTSGNGGTAVLNPDGTVTFTPNANFNGVADFTYTVTDGALTSNTATVTVNVAPVNDAPVAVNDSLVASEDTPITYTANDLLSNDSDVDGDTLTIASVTSGNGGTAVLNPDGTVTFTPNANFNGVADFTYTVTDGALTSNTATVTVNVAPVNDAPVAVNDSLV